jgi:hypothetical protein
MTRFFVCCLIIIYTLGLPSCNIINPIESTPRFLQIDSVKLDEYNYNVHGATTQKIRDVWVYANNNLLGAFELPAKVPILGDNITDLTIIPGVLRNGIATDRIRYTYYEPYNTKIDWPLGTNKIITPTFKYVADTRIKMQMNDDFEIGNSFTPANKDTPIIKTNNSSLVQYGNYCGYIPLDSFHTEANNVSSIPLELKQGQEYFVEMDYKSTVPITIYAFAKYASGTTSIEPLGGILPKDSWNKIYLDLGALNNVIKAKEYNLIISVKKDAGQYTGYALIDNIKVIGPKD